MAAANYMPSVDTNKDGKIGPKELKAWNKAGRPVDELDTTALGEQYGYAATLLEEYPELSSILTGILQDGITDPNLQMARITNSEWYKSYLPQYLQVEKARAGQNPDIWSAQVNAQAKKIQDKYTAAGVPIDDATAAKYAEQMIYGSSGDARTGDFEIYNEDWLASKIDSSIDFTKTKTIGGIEIYDLSGTAEKSAEALYQMAYEYGVDTSMTNTGFTRWFENSLGSFARGEVAAEDIDDELQTMAISQFPGMAQQLQRGLTLRQAANPYLKAIGDTLGYDADALDLNDDLVQRVLNSTDEQGNFKPMSLYEAKLAARKDDRWQYTETAKKEYTDIASTILKDFGFEG
jgi:hypothetical protein